MKIILKINYSQVMQSKGKINGKGGQCMLEIMV
jgi:hypothetical protein